MPEVVRHFVNEIRQACAVDLRIAMELSPQRLQLLGGQLREYRWVARAGTALVAAI